MEREIQSAREIQQVLVPEALPAVEGYAVTSAYQPALEVGGDFFQIIPNADGSTIVALGDVSGKGLKAGMNVAMIVGVLRAEAGNTNPAEILGALNRCLAGRMAGGFATGMVFRIDQDGAGHLCQRGPSAALPEWSRIPAGCFLAPGTHCLLRLHRGRAAVEPGDQLSVYTDGLLEATSPRENSLALKEWTRSSPTAQPPSRP